MSKKKPNYSAEFKTKVVMDLLSGQHTLNELAEQYQIALATLSSWNRQFQERASEVFRKGKNEAEQQVEVQAQHIAHLEQKVGQLTVECDWLKKKSDEIFGSDGAHRTRFPRK